jgi:hypothetical protein
MKYFLILIFAFCILLGCSSISVNYDYDPGTDFSKFKTFKLYDKRIKGDALSQNPLVRKRVLAALEKALTDKGYTKGEGDEVDFVAVAQAGIKERVQIDSWGGYGWYRPGWGTYGHTDVTYYDEANLIINIVDAGRKELAWRGVASGVVKEYSSGEAMQEGLNKILAKTLRDFPPTEK